MAITKLLTTEQVCEILSITDRTIYNKRAAGKFPKPIMIGRLIRYRESDIEEYIEELASVAA